MEKVGSVRNKILFLLGIFILALAFSAAMPSAEAGTVMAAPEKPEQLAPGESYPESRFGHAPARVDTGVSQGYASRAVEDLEASDEADAATQPTLRRTGGSRSPAGLEFATGPNSGSAASGTHAPLARGVQPQILSESAFGSVSAEPATVAARRGVQEVALIASDLGYFPRTVFVSRDVPVRLFVTGSSKNTLCIMMDSFSVRKQVRSQKIEEITFTPNMPGKYRFYCPVNGMEGTLVVKEFAGQGEFAVQGASSASDTLAAKAAAPVRKSRRPAGEEDPHAVSADDPVPAIIESGDER